MAAFGGEAFVTSVGVGTDTGSSVYVRTCTAAFLFEISLFVYQYGPYCSLSGFYFGLILVLILRQTHILA